MGSSHRAKHGLYRKRFSAEEQETFDALMLDTNFEDMRAEVALLRMIIDRCVKAIVEGDEWRVPMQALPQYMEKLLKVVERMKPSGSTHLIKEDDLDRELKQIFKQEAALRDAARGTEE